MSGSYQSIIDVANELQPTLSDVFQRAITAGFNRKEYWPAKLEQTIPSSTTLVKFAYDDYFFQFRITDNLQDEQQFVRPTAKSQIIQVKKWAPKGIQLHETELASYDKAGLATMLANRISMLGSTWNLMALDRVVNSLLYGDTDPYYVTSFDNEQLFSQNHKIGIEQATWSNFFPGLQFSSAGYAQIIENFKKIPYGDPTTNIKYLPVAGARMLIVVPPNMEKAVNLIFTQDYLYTGVTSGVNAISENPYNLGSYAAFKPEIIVEENLADDPDSWYVIMVPPTGGRPYAHVIQQTESTRALIANLDPKSVNMQMHGFALWSARSYEEVYPTFPWMFTKCTGGAIS